MLSLIQTIVRRRSSLDEDYNKSYEAQNRHIRENATSIMRISVVLSWYATWSMHLNFIAFRENGSSYGVNHNFIKRHVISSQHLSVTEFCSRGCWYPRQQNCHSKEEDITWLQNVGPDSLQILGNNELDALFHVFIYFVSLLVSSVTALIIRRSNCSNTSSGMISLCKWLLGMPVRRELQFPPDRHIKQSLTQTNHTRLFFNTFDLLMMSSVTLETCRDMK